MSEYLIQGDTLTNIADSIRTLDGSSEALNPEEMSMNLESLNTELGEIASEQTSLISDIMTALEGKSAGIDCKSLHVYYPYGKDTGGITVTSFLSAYTYTITIYIADFGDNREFVGIYIPYLMEDASSGSALSLSLTKSDDTYNGFLVDGSMSLFLQPTYIAYGYSGDGGYTIVIRQTVGSSHLGYVTRDEVFMLAHYIYLE